MRGETVLLELADGTTKDVDNVLVYQSDATDLTVLDVQTRFINQARYKGDTSTVTAIWPKAERSDLNEAHVTLRGERYRVYSRPMPLDDAVCPTSWNRRVTLLRSLFLYKATLHKATPTQDEWGTWVMDMDEGREVPVNLLRLAGSMEHDDGRTALEHLVMLEIDNADYDGEVWLHYEGGLYEVTDTAHSSDTVVMTCQRRPEHG